MNTFLKYAWCIFLLTSTCLVSAQDYVLYGDEPALADNLIITIDDCSIEENTRRIFDLLHAQKINGVFFPNTRYIGQHDPQLWRDIAASGFEIGYHTRRHLSGMTPAELNRDFRVFQDELREILSDPNYTVRYVRPPNGLWNADWLMWAESSGLYTVRWSFTVPAADVSYINDVLHRGGSILLMHTGLNDVDWLEQNLPSLQALTTHENVPYRITTLSTALND